MGDGIQPQGHVQVLVNIIDLGMGLQPAIDAPRYRYMSGRAVLLEDEIPATVPATVSGRLIALGHVRASPPGLLRSSMGGGQAIMIDPLNGLSWARPIHAKMDWLSVIDPQADGCSIKQ